MIYDRDWLLGLGIVTAVEDANRVTTLLGAEC